MVLVGLFLTAPGKLCWSHSGIKSVFIGCHCGSVQRSDWCCCCVIEYRIVMKNNSYE